MTARSLTVRSKRLLATAALAACGTAVLASTGASAANAGGIQAKAPAGASAGAAAATAGHGTQAKLARRSCRSTMYWTATCRPRLINWAVLFARNYAAGHPRQIGGFHFDSVGYIGNCGYIAPNEARCTLTLPGYRLVPGGEWGLDYTRVPFRKIVTVFAHVDQFNRVGRTVRDNQSGLF
jgi:hypothetical protein